MALKKTPPEYIADIVKTEAGQVHVVFRVKVFRGAVSDEFKVGRGYYQERLFRDALAPLLAAGGWTIRMGEQVIVMPVVVEN